MTIFVY